METLVDRLMGLDVGTQSNSVSALRIGVDTYIFLFASADTLAGHAQGTAHDGATEEFEQDHGEVQ